MRVKTRSIGLPILTYHAIGAGRGPTSTDRAWFLETLAALQAADFHPVDLQDWLARGRPDEPKGYAIAFDDGLRSFLEVADELQSYRIPATIFVVTDRVGKDNQWHGQRCDVVKELLLDWSELEALARAGFRIAAHGCTHFRLDRLSQVELEDELQSSRDAIEERLGQACTMIAYPYGFSSPRVERAASCYFSAGFSTRLDHASRSQNPFQTARIDAHYLRTRTALSRFLNDEWRLELRVRRGLRRVKSYGFHLPFNKLTKASSHGGNGGCQSLVSSTAISVRSDHSYPRSHMSRWLSKSFSSGQRV